MSFESLRTVIAQNQIALSAEPPRVDIDTSIAQTLVLMNERRCDHVAVADRGRVLGVLSRSELSAWMIRNQQEQLDSAIRAVKFMGLSNRRGVKAGEMNGVSRFA